jgi:long-subunit acyl-CoA synthetase (AMP-forming)
VKKWAAENNKVYDLDALCTDWDLRKRVKESLLKLATDAKFNSLEKPKEFVLITEPMTIANNMLTPTFKYKRN